MSQVQRRFVGWALALFACWVAIRSLGAVAGGWPWSEDRPRTVLVTVLLAILVTGMFLSLANLLAGILAWPARDEQKPRR